VVDSSSIEVNRRARRVKTDRMEVGKLLTMLMRYDNGERPRYSIEGYETTSKLDFLLY
jgi:transposase